MPKIVASLLMMGAAAAKQSCRSRAKRVGWNIVVCLGLFTWAVDVDLEEFESPVEKAT